MLLREVAVVPAFESSTLHRVGSYRLFIELFYKDEFSRKQNKEKLNDDKFLFINLGYYLGSPIVIKKGKVINSKI